MPIPRNQLISGRDKDETDDTHC